MSGTVDALGAGVADVGAGEQVLGVADFASHPSAGASDFAILRHWTTVPDGLGLEEAAALTMAIETPFRSLDSLGVAAGCTLLVHGAGTMMGYAAVQTALMRGARVIATAGDTFAGRLRAFGATVTGYGEGMVERVLSLCGAHPDLVLDTAPASGALPDLVRIAGGDPRRVLTITDFPAAEALGVRGSSGEGITLRYDVLGTFARHAAEGRFEVPIAQTFPLEDWREAMRISQSGRARGKLLLIPGNAAVGR